jgi:hypothetical protein
MSNFGWKEATLKLANLSQRRIEVFQHSGAHSVAALSGKMRMPPSMLVSKGKRNRAGAATFLQVGS